MILEKNTNSSKYYLQKKIDPIKCHLKNAAVSKATVIFYCSYYYFILFYAVVAVVFSSFSSYKCLSRKSNNGEDCITALRNGLQSKHNNNSESKKRKDVFK